MKDSVARKLKMPKKNKILLSIPALRGGGAERVMSIIANKLAKSGWDVQLLTYANPAEKPFYKLDENISLVQLDCLDQHKIKRIMSLVKRFLGLRKQIKKFHPDVILSFLDTNNILTLLSSVGLKIPVIVSERTNPKISPISNFKKIIRDWAYKKADCLVVQNKGIQKIFFAEIGVKADVIPNPIAIHPEVKWKGHQKEFITLGRLEEAKGYTYLIEAFSKIKDQHPDWVLKIFGNGKDKDKFKNQIRSLNMENRIFINPSISKPAEEISKSKIFVFSSLFEGMPNALMEAMAIGMPVISTDCDFGPSDLIKNNKNGLLVPIKNSEKLAEAMSRLAKDSNLQNSLGNAAADSMKKYEINKVVLLWENVFKKVMKKNE